MKKTISFILLGLVSSLCFAQQETYDVLTYTPPKGWKKDVKENVIVYSVIDNAKKIWCQVGIYKSTTSKGNLDADFVSEWDELVNKPYHVPKAEQVGTSNDINGWKVKGGSGIFDNHGSNAMVILTTMSGFDRAVSIVSQTNSESYVPAIQALVGSVKLSRPATQNSTVSSAKTTPHTSTSVPTPITAVKSNYKFNTTNFDDGWVATEQADWVTVAKGNMRVLLHYPKQGTDIAADPDPVVRNAWDILVAPRYRNLRNFKIVSPSDWQRPYFGGGNVTDAQSGKEVYVALFKKANTGWMEFIAPDKQTFVSQFGADQDKMDSNTDNSVWNEMMKMPYYNRFAVDAADIAGTGTWKDKFSANTFYTNVYTGLSVGMSTYSSSQESTFSSGANYSWHLVAANSYGGSTKFAQAKGNGNFKVQNGWKISFSDIEGKPKTFDVYFACIKGGRVLFIDGNGFAR